MGKIGEKKIYLKLFIRKKGVRCDDKEGGIYATICRTQRSQGANRLAETFRGYTYAIPGWLPPRQGLEYRILRG